MVFSGVGDVLGFKSGFWKFYKVGNDIFEELKLMGGLFVLNVKCNIILNLVLLLYINNKDFFLFFGNVNCFFFSKIW